MIKKEVPTLPILNNIRQLPKKTIMDMLGKMLLIRYCEERIAQRVTEGKIHTPCHLYIGEEASAVGVCSSLNDTDFVFSNHRSHGHFLAKGGSVRQLFAEVYCKASGCSGGRGGSMHLCDPSKGLLGSSSIVAGSLGIGLGPALRSKILGEKVISVIFHGDCVPEEGIWHESLNFAAVKKLPVVYICENNLYAASSPLEERRVYDNIADIASDYGVHSQVVDGNDIFAVNNAAVECIMRARNGEGPQLIENRTYRWLGHVGPHDDIDVGLRSYQELQYWKKRCPIKNLEDKLIKERICCSQEINSLHEKVQFQIDDAESYALDSPYPDANSVLANVYKGRE